MGQAWVKQNLVNLQSLIFSADGIADLYLCTITQNQDINCSKSQILRHLTSFVACYAEDDPCEVKPLAPNMRRFIAATRPGLHGKRQKYSQ